jgi:hypothetical protein
MYECMPPWQASHSGMPIVREAKGVGAMQNTRPSMFRSMRSAKLSEATLPHARTRACQEHTPKPLFLSCGSILHSLSSSLQKQRLHPRAGVLADNTGVDQLNRPGVSVLQENVIHQLVNRWRAGREGRGERDVHLGADLLVQGLELLGVHPALVNDALLRHLDRVAVGPDLLDVVAGPVGRARVGHRVAVVAVGVHLKDERAVAGAAVLDREVGARTHVQHVHAVDLELRGAERSDEKQKPSVCQ